MSADGGSPAGTTAGRRSEPAPAARVAVVTDSTAQLSADDIARFGIRTVPLRVQIGSRSGRDRTACFFSLDTLEYLRRGGRIGAAAALFGTALSVKPLLHERDGRILPLEKVRTSGRALTRLVAHAADVAGYQAVEMVVQHLSA